MNKQKLITIAVLGMMLGAVPVQAQMHEGHEHGSAMEQAEELGAVEVGNKVCPVSGEKVGMMGDIVKAEYNGKIYNLCCAMCKKDFLKNPEKYRAIAEEEIGNGQLEEKAHESMDGHHHE